MPMGGARILIPPNPGTPTPLAIADFKNEDYTIGVETVALSDMFVADVPNWLPFNPADIHNGVGYAPTIGGGPVLVDAFAADFLTNGFSFLAIFTGGNVLFERVDFPAYAQEAKTSCGGSGDVSVELGAQSNNAGAGGAGTQYASGRLSAARMALSSNGDSVVAITPDTALIGDHIGISFSASSNHVLEYIEFHAGDLTDAELIAMSINTFPRIASADTPTPTGSLTQGAVLTCPHGAWSNAPTSYAYQWYSGAFDPPIVVGETAATYTTQVADIDSNVWCVVTATNATGSGLVESGHVGPITA